MFDLEYTNLLNTKLNWRKQSDTPAPLDVPVLCKPPSGAFVIHKGRQLLGWTEWCLVSEVLELLNSL